MLHRGQRGDRHDAGEDRLRDPARGQLLPKALVFLELEEELSYREVRELELGRQVIAVACQIGRTRVPGGMSGDADRPKSGAASELDQLRRVLQLLVRLLRRKRIPAECQEVLHADGSEPPQDLTELEAGVRHAGQMGHRRQGGVLDEVDDDARGALAGYPATPVRDRDEGRIERLKVGDRSAEQSLLVIVLRREELERESSPGRQKIGDAIHATEFSGGRFGR